MDDLPLVDIIPPAAAWAEASSSLGLAWTIGLTAGVLTVLVWMAWRRQPGYRLRRLVDKILASAKSPYHKATIVARAARLFVARERPPGRLGTNLQPMLLRLDEERFKAVPSGERVHGILREMRPLLQQRPPE